MNVIIIGNGILGLTTAYRLAEKDKSLKVTIVGPNGRIGCASLAAAAMLNSICEVDTSTKVSEPERGKFQLNRQATALWPNFLEKIQLDSDMKLHYGFGTYLVNNHATDALEDLNFDAVLETLKELAEPYENISANEIPKYNPSPRLRAARAIYIPGEGWLNPVLLISALESILRKNNRITFIDDECISLNKVGDTISNIALKNNGTLSGDCYFLAPGAVYSKIIDNSNFVLPTPRVFYGVGCSLLLKTDENTLTKCVRTPNRGLACGIYAAPYDSNHIVVGASNYISASPEYHARLESVRNILQSAMEQLNTHYYRSQIVKINIGWRPTSADTVPLIGKTSVPNLFIATGTKRDGLHCSPLISDIMSNLILGKENSADISLFKPERELIRSFSREEAIDLSLKHTINAAYQHGFQPPNSTMTTDLNTYYRSDLEALHDKVGAIDWGIPPEMMTMYRYGHLK